MYKRNIDILAFIPAREGSVSIPLKNMARLGDTPLVGWSLHAATKSTYFAKIVVSTDSDVITNYVSQFKGMSGDDRIECVQRPKHLTDGLSYPIQDVVIDYLKSDDNYAFVALFQPTSPFVTQWHIEECIINLREKFNSSYTITKVKHNDHWINQRVLYGGEVEFKFPDHHANAWNKQRKIDSYKFGNFTVCKTKLIKNGFFPTPARGIVIDWIDAFDVDTLDDLRMAEQLLPLRLENHKWEESKVSQ